jgi:hypothetical protein
VHKQFLTPPLAVHLTRLRLLCLFAQKSSSESFLASRASYAANDSMQNVLGKLGIQR